MTPFPISLRHRVTAKQLHLTDDEVAILLQHVGDLDPTIRDQTVYTLFARGFDEQALSLAQKQQIQHFLFTQRSLFQQICQPENDTVYLRSFTALLTALVLDDDAQSPWLTPVARSQFFTDALTYLPAERDTRGWVPGYGWAPPVAHGSDLLGAAWRHPQFPCEQSPQALAAISHVFQNRQTPFLNDEEPRLANALVQAAAVQHLSQTELTDWLQATDIILWSDFSFTNLVASARIHNWLSFCHHLYFLLPVETPVHHLLTELSEHYYQMNGYR